MPVEFKDYYATLGVPRDASEEPNSSERGDLYVVVNVQLPQQLSDEERELWEKLRRVSSFNPRDGSR